MRGPRKPVLTDRVLRGIVALAEEDHDSTAGDRHSQDGLHAAEWARRMIAHRDAKKKYDMEKRDREDARHEANAQGTH